MIPKSAVPVALLAVATTVKSQERDIYRREADASVYQDPSQAIAFDKRAPYDWADYESFMTKRYADPELDLDGYGYDLYARDARDADRKPSLLSKLGNQAAGLGQKAQALSYEGQKQLTLSNLGNHAAGLGKKVQALGFEGQNYQDGVSKAATGLAGAGKDYLRSLTGNSRSGNAPQVHPRDAVPDASLDDPYLYARDPYYDADEVAVYARSAREDQRSKPQPTYQRQDAFREPSSASYQRQNAFRAPTPASSPKSSKIDKPLAHQALSQAPSVFSTVPDIVKSFRKAGNYPQRRSVEDAYLEELYAREALPEDYYYYMQSAKRSAEPEAEAEAEANPEADADAVPEAEEEAYFDLFTREADAEPDLEFGGDV